MYTCEYLIYSNYYVHLYIINNMTSTLCKIAYSRYDMVEEFVYPGGVVTGLVQRRNRYLTERHFSETQVLYAQIQDFLRKISLIEPQSKNLDEKFIDQIEV